MVWDLSYSTIFGGLTLFSAGILSSNLPIPTNKRKSLFSFITGIFLIVGLMNLFYRLGGDHGSEFNNYKFYPVLLLFPEIISIAMILLIIGLRGLNLKFKCFLLQILTHIGRISYSGYIFHLFVLDFFLRLTLAFNNSSGYISYLLQFISYMAILIMGRGAMPYLVSMKSLRTWQ
jgi:peptidoglycan/LPS O-acetylase OafA/YrhL